MEITRCPRGHFYDASQCASCPTCARENGQESGITFARPNYGVTEPVRTEAAAFPATEPVRPAAGAYTATEPISRPASDAGLRPGEYAPTMPVGVTAGESQPGKAPLNPVVGWLVCVEGANKGADYRIRSQYNYIGRAQHMDICIPGDSYISTERAAVLAYDDRDRQFSFGPGMGHNIVRVNDAMVLSPVVLKAYDRITVGRTELLFIPLCGERFGWDETK